jgi:aspartate/tyrosine/aromatic aminotransferase
MTITKLEWRKCPCGSPACKRKYPINIGVFYAGTGFSPDEVELLNKVFAVYALHEARLKIKQLKTDGSVDSVIIGLKNEVKA